MPGSLVDEISPYTRVATALVPFLIAIVLRLVFGKNRTTRILLSVSTTWFAVIILLTPYSVEMQREVNRLMSVFH